MVTFQKWDAALSAATLRAFFLQLHFSYTAGHPPGRPFNLPDMEQQHLLDWPPSQCTYKTEWNTYLGRPVARVYVNGERTSAFVVLDLWEPKPEFLMQEQWEKAQDLQMVEDRKPF